MRNISFALTTHQFRDRSKTVTRRIGWTKLKPGDLLMGVVKGMGLKPGEKVERLGAIRVVSVRQEELQAMTRDLDYGFKETTLEGYPAGTVKHYPSAFVEFFCASHKGCTPSTLVTRIEFEYVDGWV